MPRKSEQEWAVIENEYITMPVTFDKLRDKHNISKQAIITKSIKEDWHSKREKYLSATNLKRQEQHIRVKVKEEWNVIAKIEEMRNSQIKLILIAVNKFIAMCGENKSIKPQEIANFINKLKDNVSELTKTIENLKGNPYESLSIDFKGTEGMETPENRLNVLGFNN